MQLRKSLGFYNKTDLATALGISNALLDYYYKKDYIEQPTHTMKRGVARYYNQEEFDSLVEKLQPCFEEKNQGIA